MQVQASSQTVSQLSFIALFSGALLEFPVTKKLNKKLCTALENVDLREKCH